MNTRILHRWYLGAILLAAAVLLLSGSWFCYTSTKDTATVGLMAVNIVEGERPLFYYGQNYFGALEAYAAALFVSLFGFSEFVLSLAPISFTLAWVFFSYLLFSRIHNRTAGLVAAACTAFPGYYVFWYSIGTYGGYSAIPCIGTALLWLSLRVFQENPEKSLLVLHALAIGILMALGIWVHPLTYSYLAVSACLLGLTVIRKRFSPYMIMSLVLAAAIAFTGFLPLYSATGSIFGALTESAPLTLSHVAGAFYSLFFYNIYDLIVWNFLYTFEIRLVRYLILVSSLGVLAIAGAFAVAAVLRARDKWGEKIHYLVPASFCLFFLTMYVQHHLAIIKAPRYAISFLLMLLCATWSLAIAGWDARRPVKIFMVILFGVWIAHQITGTLLYISGSRASAVHERSVMREVVDAARRDNLRSVVMYGDSLFGMKSPKFSMYSGNTIAFAHADAERYQPNAQLTETDEKRGYLTSTDYRQILEDTLRSLGVGYNLEKIDEYFLFSHLQTGRRHAMRSIPGDEIRTFPDNDGNTGGLLTDRSQDYTAELKMTAGKSLVFDTGRLRNLCGVRLTAPQHEIGAELQPPGRFTLSVSNDGIDYRNVYTSLPRAAYGFHAGPSVYIGGPLPTVEILFAPAEGRYIKINFPEMSGFRASEMFVFEAEEGLQEDYTADRQEIVRLINEHDLDFVLADRWISAGLRERFMGEKNEDIALARHGTKYNTDSLRSFVRPAQGRGLVCEAAVADECGKILAGEYGGSVISRRFDLRNYSLFILAEAAKDIDLSAPSALLWNGHFPLESTDMTILAPLFNSMGLPVWRADFSRTRGIYHDSWTNGKGVFYNLDYTIKHGKDRELYLHTHGWRPDTGHDGLELRLLANDRIPLPFTRKEKNTYVFSLPDSLDRLDRLEIRSATFTPQSADSRKLGLDIQRIEIR